MENLSHLLYFLNYVKKTLSFKDTEDFIFKIKNDFDFRLKVQKFVYIAKYFGWNHSYDYVFYLRGPYSTDLADEYYSEGISYYAPLKIEGFEDDLFNKFVSDKSIDYLESVSTILYNRYIEDNLSQKEIINHLHLIKPHISPSVVKTAYEDIIKFGISDNNRGYEDPTLNLDNMEKNIKTKLSFYINYFKYFNRCNNSVIVSGSLDYLRITLKEENLSSDMKKDLLNLIDSYIEDVEKIYFLCDDNPELFKEMNLEKLEDFFDRLQNYISQELDIIPRLDDDEFDEMFY